MVAEESEVSDLSGKSRGISLALMLRRLYPSLGRLALGALLAVVTMGLVACEDDKPKASPAAVAKKKKRRRRKKAAAKAPAKPTLPTLVLTDQDFVEGVANRDPFRSFLGEFAKPVREVTRTQRKVKLQRYGLDEIKLIGIVTGGVRPRAMFRNPKGVGVVVVRGEYISKSEGRVKDIRGDKVIIEITGSSEEQLKVADRTIELHPKKRHEEEEL